MHMMGLDLEVVTIELNKSVPCAPSSFSNLLTRFICRNLDWFGPSSGHVKDSHRLTKADHYHGEF